MTNTAAAQEPETPSDEEGVDASQLSPTEAVSVIFDTLVERDRVDMKRILKSACALLDFECEFHDEQEPEGG